MSKKHTVSLQEFFKSHGTPSIHENLPVRPRCDRDADQGLHLRLAQNCSLDSGKSYPQRHGPGKEGPYAEYDSYGSSDGAPVGDVDYHRPNSHHAPAGPYHSSGSSSSHYARRQVPPPHSSSRHDWSAQYNSEHPGAGPHPRGPVMPAGMAPPGAGPMGPRVHPGSLGSYGPVPNHVPPPQHLYGPPGGYGVPPQHIHGPPAGVYGGRPDAAPAQYGQDGFAGLQHGPGPVASGYGGHAPPHMLEHPMPNGAGGHGMLPPLYAMPPPPPPPRQLSQQQVVVGGPPVVPSSAGGSYVPAPESNRPAAPTQIEARAADTAPIRKATPFADPAPAPETPSEPSAPVCPKNEFAERLAARALASAARAKSSLLAGGGSSSALSAASSLSRVDSVSGAAGKPPASCGALEVPAGAATGACGVDSNASSPSEQGGVFLKPSHPFGRPKLALKPRSVLVDTAANGSYSSTSSDSGDAPADHGSTTGSTASSVNGGRPRLYLLPRGSSLTDSASASAAGARKPSVFGEAKPREEVLKGRGLDPSLVDAAVEIGRKQHDSAPARQGSAADRASHASYTSRVEDEWHTVAGHGRKGSAARQEHGMPELDAFDPFFGSSSGSIAAKPVSNREYVAVPPPRAFSRDIMRDGYVGRHGSDFSSPRNRVEMDGDDDAGGVFRRALPTRQVPLAL